MNALHIKDYHGKNAHFIGIGGISMSALAEILLSRGYNVSGSDVSDSDLLKRLASKGAKIHLGHDPSYVDNADIVVYTAAVKPDNPEMQEALRKNLPILQRAELLGQIMQTFPVSIGVSGSHGKTTTTSMISMALLKAGLDPTVLIGGELNDLGGNVRIGHSPYFITEACEYVGSFLHFHPFIAVILNIDRDHLDYFKDIDHIYDTFLKFAKLVPSDGYVVGCTDDPLVERLMSEVNCNTISYGIAKKADMYAETVEFDSKACASFDAIYKGQTLGHISLKVPGRHNIYNALATLATVKAMGIKINEINEALQHYTGTKRRFEYKGSFNGITVIDDYAHHPAEIEATLSTARTMTYNKIWCVFQPHTYTRTKKLFNEFVTALSGIDHVIITDIYSAREKDTKEIHSRHLTDAISNTGENCIYISSFDDIADYLYKNAQPGDLLITMGAGDVHVVGEKLLMMT
jgi:UDP-N-acetylmuramate--alanine ligase